MRVHDDADSKYGVMGKSSKLTMKRPNTIVFGKPNKMQKINEDRQCNAASIARNNDKSNVGLYQKKKSLPVYMLRKR